MWANSRGCGPLAGIAVNPADYCTANSTASPDVTFAFERLGVRVPILNTRALWAMSREGNVMVDFLEKDA
jgi:hypothetical protein